MPPPCQATCRRHLCLSHAQLHTRPPHTFLHHTCLSLKQHEIATDGLTSRSISTGHLDMKSSEDSRRLIAVLERRSDLELRLSCGKSISAHSQKLSLASSVLGDLIDSIMDEQITAMTPMRAAKRRNALCLMRREILFARANFTMRDFKLLQTRVFVNDKISS